MKKTKGLSSLLFLIIWILFVSSLLYLVYIYFGDDIFDRYVYRKSSLFGYETKEGNYCMAQLNSAGYREREFSKKRKDEYLILVVGDSIVYGQGLLKFQRYSNILERKLNKIRSTRVLNIGECGTNIYNHYLTATKFIDLLDPDLIVFGVTENDLLVWDSLGNYPQNLPKTEKLIVSEKPGEENLYMSRVLGSFNDKSDNMEMFRWLLAKLPKERSIYFFHIAGSPSFDSNNKLLKLEGQMREAGLNILDPIELYEKKYNENMTISKKEGHPNFLANEMFSESLFNEIVSNSSYEFNEILE